MNIRMLIAVMAAALAPGSSAFTVMSHTGDLRISAPSLDPTSVGVLAMLLSITEALTFHIYLDPADVPPDMNMPNFLWEQGAAFVVVGVDPQPGDTTDAIVAGLNHIAAGLQSDGVLNPSAVTSATIGFSRGSIFRQGPDSWEADSGSEHTTSPLLRIWMKDDDDGFHRYPRNQRRIYGVFLMHMDVAYLAARERLTNDGRGPMHADDSPEGILYAGLTGPGGDGWLPREAIRDHPAFYGHVTNPFQHGKFSLYIALWRRRDDADPTTLQLAPKRPHARKGRKFTEAQLATNKGGTHSEEHRASLRGKRPRCLDCGRTHKPGNCKGPKDKAALQAAAKFYFARTPSSSPRASTTTTAATSGPPCKKAKTRDDSDCSDSDSDSDWSDTAPIVEVVRRDKARAAAARRAAAQQLIDDQGPPESDAMDDLTVQQLIDLGYFDDKPFPEFGGSGGFGPGGNFPPQPPSAGAA